MYRQGQSQCWEMEEIKEHEKRNGCVSMLGKGSRKGCPQEHYHWCLHLQVLDSYQKQPTDLDWYASPTLGHLYSAAVASCSPELPVSSPLANTTWPEQVFLQWHYLLLCHPLPSTAWLSPSAFVQHHTALISAQLQHGHTEPWISFAALLSLVLLDVVVTFLLLW